jgi:acyl-CoA-binding protein
MDLFNDAVERVLQMTKEPSNEDKLKLYGLFKQSTVGDINIECPSIFNMTGRAKWAAWNEHKGKTMEQAKTKYISVVNKLANGQ